MNTVAKRMQHFFFHTLREKEMLDDVDRMMMEIKLRSTSSNIMQLVQHGGQTNECNMLESTMLDDVASTYWIRLAGPLVLLIFSYYFIFDESVHFLVSFYQ